MDDPIADPWSPDPGLSYLDESPGKRPLLKAVHIPQVPADFGFPTIMITDVQGLQGKTVHRRKMPQLTGGESCGLKWREDP